MLFIRSLPILSMPNAQNHTHTLSAVYTLSPHPVVSQVREIVAGLNGVSLAVSSAEEAVVQLSTTRLPAAVASAAKTTAAAHELLFPPGWQGEME